MKKLTFLLPLLFLTLGVFGQSYHYELLEVDTCTNTESITFLIDKTFKDPGYYAFHYRADSLTGAGDATAYFQVNIPGTGLWKTTSSETIDGALTLGMEERKLYAPKVRLKVTGTDTGTTKISGWFVFKRDR